MGLHRSVMRYVAYPSDDSSVRQRRCQLAGQYRRYGYLRLHVLLGQEGRVLNGKRTYRLYREENLRRRCRKRLPSTGHVPMTPAERAPHRWSVDLVSDSLWSGRRFCAWCVEDD
jgi:putative transposase